jgi:excisionase family DNA binding protein
VTPDAIDQRHYSTQELADLWNVHPETIRREAKRGRLRSIRVGSERRYPESAVAEYLKCNRRDRDAA